MALRQIMLSRQIEQKKKELEALRGLDASFETREADITKAIEEARAMVSGFALEPIHSFTGAS